MWWSAHPGCRGASREVHQAKQAKQSLALADLAPQKTDHLVHGGLQTAPRRAFLSPVRARFLPRMSAVGYNQARRWEQGQPDLLVAPLDFGEPGASATGVIFFLRSLTRSSSFGRCWAIIEVLAFPAKRCRRCSPAVQSRARTTSARSATAVPAPPPGKPHRYFFKLYALATPLDLAPGASKDQVLVAMKGHVLAEGQLMGRYGR